MKILVIGASGEVGRVVTAALEQNHRVIGVSRSTEPCLDLLDAESIQRFFAELGALDAIVDCAGSVAFKPLTEMSPAEFEQGVRSKALAKIDLLLAGLSSLDDGGSVTFTTGSTARMAVPGGSVAAFANGALESFTRVAATELPRGIRVNSVSPAVLEGSDALQGSFQGFRAAPLDSVAAAYVKSVEGTESGQVYVV